MISRKFRFHGYGSLNYVYRHGKTVRNSQFGIKYIKNDRRSEHRVSVVVSKKVQKSAVARNRMRRRLYEAVRQYQPAITQPFDIVITVFSAEIVDMPSTELIKSVGALLKQAEII